MKLNKHPVCKFFDGLISSSEDFDIDIDVDIVQCCNCSKDVSTVKKLVDDAIRENQDSGAFRPHDLVLGLGPMYEVHKNNHLPRLEACDWDLQELQEHCTKSKNAMNLFVHGQLQLVASLQANIRDMRNRLAVFRDALSHQVWWCSCLGSDCFIQRIIEEFLTEQ